MDSNRLTITVPDIGDFANVDVIEILVNPGEQVTPETPLITLETDKATMDIPCPNSGKIADILVKVGDQVSQGDAIVTLNPSSLSTDNQQNQQQQKRKIASPSDTSVSTSAADWSTQVVVLGAGPGGYTAAFRASDLGKQVILIERYPQIGGVCLNVGCIPSKALLHTAHIIDEAKQMSVAGVCFANPRIDLGQLRSWKEQIIAKLTGGLSALAKQRKVKVLTGVGEITSAHTLTLTTDDGKLQHIAFEHLIIATGSKAAQIAEFPNDDPRLMDSTDALALDDIPKRLLVVGGGIIGLEMATVYHALGSAVTIVEYLPDLIPGCDRDLVMPLERRLKKCYENIFTQTQVKNIQAAKAGLKVSFQGDKAPKTDIFDRVLVAIGRRANGLDLGAEKANIVVNPDGFIPVDQQQRTNVRHIFAIGDIVGQPMLAHKATHQGKVAAEVISGMKSTFDARAIPSVAYTDPEIAWMGVSETQARAAGIDYEKGVFPWVASGRALSMGRGEGLSKVLFDKNSGQVIGAGVVGVNAGELIAETILALEMGADAHDMALTIHPHPTLSETINLAAEQALGTITDLYAPKS